MLLTKQNNLLTIKYWNIFGKRCWDGKLQNGTHALHSTKKECFIRGEGYKLLH